MDLNPTDAASTGNWYKTPEQFEMNLNALLHQQYWPMERNEWTSGEQIELDGLTDDFTNRATVSRYLKNQVDGTFPLSTVMWDISYTGINRCNKIITELKKLKGQMSDEEYDRIMGNAIFYRACFYCRIMMHFGDPVVVAEDMDVDTEDGRNAAYNLSRTDMWSVLDQFLGDFDEAASLLPAQYSASEIERATKGAALGMKARYALYFASIRKWDTFGLADEASATKYFGVARDAAKAVMDLNVYSLYDDFGKLFKMSTHHTSEGIFVLPRSKSMTNDSKYEYLYGGATTAKLPRLSGAPTCCTCCPSWDLLCAFLDNQGKPIDESTVYDPNNPFLNRDPRLSQTIVPFGSEHLGVIFNPSFDADSVYSSRYGGKVVNNDSRTYKIEGNSNQYASYNGLVLNKMVDNDWLSPFEAENDKIILRYADILLMYAEAKIELNDIDASTLEAINTVRARAYKVAVTSSAYPKVTATDQTTLRTVLRSERRMEFAFENLRLYDILRWRIGEKVLNRYNYGLPKKNQTLQRSYMDNGMWFMGAVPDIDADDCPDFTKTVKGNADFFNTNKYAQKLSQRVFVGPKSYLWPIPTTTTQVMKNISQNQGY
jgi:hypothetical protein